MKKNGGGTPLDSVGSISAVGKAPPPKGQGNDAPFEKSGDTVDLSYIIRAYLGMDAPEVLAR